MNYMISLCYIQTDLLLKRCKMCKIKCFLVFYLKNLMTYYTASCFRLKKNNINYYVSHSLRKPAKCLGENKDADQLRGNCEADQRLCFRYTDSTLPLLFNPKFQASSLLLLLHRPVCVGPVRNFPRGDSIIILHHVAG